MTDPKTREALAARLETHATAGYSVGLNSALLYLDLREAAAALREPPAETSGDGLIDPDSALHVSEIATAEIVAILAHYGQVTRSEGMVFLNHPAAVMASVRREYRAVAWLHDVLEDSAFTPAHLAAVGIEPSTIDAVKLLTRDEGRSYHDYIESIAVSGNLAAITVKIADLRHNLRPSCPASLAERYRPALARLEVVAAPPKGGEAHGRRDTAQGNSVTGGERIRTNTPTREKMDISVELHRILGAHGIASLSSRDQFATLPDDLIHWAVRACEQSQPQPKEPTTLDGQCGCDGPTRIDPACRLHGYEPLTPDARDDRMVPPADPQESRCAWAHNVSGRHEPTNTKLVCGRCYQQTQLCNWCGREIAQVEGVWIAQQHQHALKVSTADPLPPPIIAAGRAWNDSVAGGERPTTPRED